MFGRRQVKNPDNGTSASNEFMVTPALKCRAKVSDPFGTPALPIKYRMSKLSVFLQLMIFGMLGRRAPVSS